MRSSFSIPISNKENSLLIDSPNLLSKKSSANTLLNCNNINIGSPNCDIMKRNRYITEKEDRNLASPADFRLKKYTSSSSISSPKLSVKPAQKIMVKVNKQRITILSNKIGKNSGENGSNSVNISLNNSSDTTLNSINYGEEENNDFDEINVEDNHQQQFADLEGQSPRKQQKSKVLSDVGMLRILSRVPQATKNHRDSKGRRGGVIISSEAIINSIGSSIAEL